MKMTIAIAANAPELTSQIAMHGARAPFFLLFDKDGSLHTVLANPYVQVERGAEPQVANILDEHKVKLLVASGLGTKFTSALERKGIDYVRKFGRVSGAVSELVASV